MFVAFVRHACMLQDIKMIFGVLLGLIKNCLLIKWTTFPQTLILTACDYQLVRVCCLVNTVRTAKTNPLEMASLMWQLTTSKSCATFPVVTRLKIKFRPSLKRGVQFPSRKFTRAKGAQIIEQQWWLLRYHMRSLASFYHRFTLWNRQRESIPIAEKSRFFRYCAWASHIMLPIIIFYVLKSEEHVCKYVMFLHVDSRDLTNLCNRWL